MATDREQQDCAQPGRADGQPPHDLRNSRDRPRGLSRVGLRRPIEGPKVDGRARMHLGAMIGAP